MMLVMTQSVHAIGPPEIYESTLEQNITDPTADDKVQITVNISYVGSFGTAKIHYKVDSGSWKTVNMSLIAGTVDNGTWRGEIPKQSEGSKVQYYINATNPADTDISATYSYTVEEEDESNDDDDPTDLQIDPALLIGGIVIGGIAVAGVVVVVLYLQKRT